MYNDETLPIPSQTLVPFIFAALVFDGFYVWIVIKYFRVVVDEKGIEILKIGKNKFYDWDDIIAISNVWLWKGSIFKVETIERSFFIHADSPKIGFQDMFRSEFRTEMGEYFRKRKILN